MGRSPIYFAFFIGTGAIFAAMVALPSAHAEWSGDESDHGHGKPVYQRHAFDWMDKHDGWHGRGHGQNAQWAAPQVNAGWFQRPYPYHLDYYKMRYGGSYAPYFGNLYGPPQVVTAPPYYGPYYGNWGYGWPEGYNGYNGATTEHPGYPPGTIMEGPVENSTPSSQPADQPNGEGLPAPSQ